MAPRPAEKVREEALIKRSCELQLLMSRTPGLMERLDDGRAEVERGETLTLAELDAALAEMD